MVLTVSSVCRPVPGRGIGICIPPALPGFVQDVLAGGSSGTVYTGGVPSFLPKCFTFFLLMLSSSSSEEVFSSGCLKDKKKTKNYY